VDEAGDVLESSDPTGGEAAWEVVAIDSPHVLMGISCPTVSFCAAVDTKGNLLIGTGSAAAQDNLTITKAGSGSGAVTSAPSGIACGASCSHAFDEGMAVTLSATADTGSIFTGWSGACSGTAICEVTMEEDKSITASFALVSGGEEQSGAASLAAAIRLLPLQAQSQAIGTTRSRCTAARASRRSWCIARRGACG
jgi:hypothetical protein